MKQNLIVIAVSATALFVSCKEKPAETARPETVASAARASEAAAKAQEQEPNQVPDEKMEAAVAAQAEMTQRIGEQLARLDKIGASAAELRSAIKDATETDAILSVKSGRMTQGEADRVIKDLENLDQVPNSQLRYRTEQIKLKLRAAQYQNQ